MSSKARVRPDGASRAVAYAKVILAERLENPFDEAGNCYILYGTDSVPVKTGFLMLPTSDNIFYLILPQNLKWLSCKRPDRSPRSLWLPHNVITDISDFFHPDQRPEIWRIS